MKMYEILEHTADLKIRVFGRIKEELFLNAVLAMIECMQPVVRVKPSVQKIHDRGFFALMKDRLINRLIKREIKISSSNLETLLVDFLSEVLYLIQTKKEIYNNINFEKFSDTNLEVVLTGRKVESFGEDIKGVTYHDLEIKQKPDKSWEATIVFDI